MDYFSHLYLNANNWTWREPRQPSKTKCHDGERSGLAFSCSRNFFRQRTNKEQGYLLDSKMSKEDIEYVYPIPEERYNDVIEHLRFNFFADEPLNQCVGLCETGRGHSELELHSILTLQDNLSVMAVSRSGQVVGVALNGIQHEGDVDEAMKKLETLTDKKFKQIFSMLYELNQSLNLFKRYDVTSVFECRILSVDNSYRGRGLANELFKLSLDVASKAGFKVFKVDATGVFSQRISTKLGLETLVELEYRNHLDPATGQPLFSPPPPHTSLKVMVKILQ